MTTKKNSRVSTIRSIARGLVFATLATLSLTVLVPSSPPPSAVRPQAAAAAPVLAGGQWGGPKNLG